MDIFETPENPDRHRIQSSEFDPVEDDPKIMREIEFLSISVENNDRNFHRSLSGFSEERSQQIVYTFAHKQSNNPESTIPVFEIDILNFPTYENANLNRSPADDPMSAYREYVRSLFLREDKHGRVQGLGPIGECLKLSQEMEVVLYIKGINRVPNQTQSAFFQLLESPPSMEFGQNIDGDQKNLTVFVTTDIDSGIEDIERKLSSLLHPISAK